MERKKVTVLELQAKKDRGERITMLTAYDYGAASMVDEAGIDVILVGDSLGMVVMGLASTTPVTMEEMIHHCKAVARGAGSCFLVGDMPFLAYQVSQADAIRNAGRFLKEAGMHSVKLEGGREMAPTVRAIVDAGIPVMGHIGLTPQSITKLGGYRVQGKTAAAALKLVDDAMALEEAGCFAIVLEAVPAAVAAAVTDRLHIPTIGIGAGAGCDGQVLVYHDLLGLHDGHQPRFVKQYAHIRPLIVEAFRSYGREVAGGAFPAEEHTYPMSAEEEAEFRRALAETARMS
jgi:3-methyl-2-oxobutanoate hydroxymethyltransferase